MANLFAYKIDSGTTIGIDTLSWNENALSGNTPFVISASTTYPGYDNISSIVNWDSLGELAGYRHCKVRQEIKSIYETQTGTTWSAYTLDEQKVLSKYFIVDKDKRDEVHTQQEQDDYNHFKLYDFLSDDVVERIGEFNPKTTPKSLNYKIDVQQRFHPKYRFDIYGFLTGVTYYENLDVTINQLGFHVFNYSGPVVEYSAAYTSGADGYVQSRVVTRHWYMMDDSMCDDPKITYKIYEPLVAREEGRRRRVNLINRLLIDTVGLIILSSQDLNNVAEAEEDAITFMHDIESDITAYYESGVKKDAQGNPCKLIQSISAHTYSRLDNPNPYNTGTTIRDFILYRLDP